MIVICIDVSSMGSIKGNNGITINKRYEVISERCDHKNEIYYQILNDDGFKADYRKIRFISLEEVRETKLKELGV